MLASEGSCGSSAYCNSQSSGIPSLSLSTKVEVEVLNTLFSAKATKDKAETGTGRGNITGFVPNSSVINTLL